MLAGIRTPTAVVDVDRLQRNIDEMGQKANDLGVRLRPHVKTHKSIEIGRMQTAGQFGGITVSTFAEASAFADAGFRDMTWALPFPLNRLSDAVDLIRRVDHLQLLVDHPTTAASMSEYAVRKNVVFDVLLKVDCGNHRCGVDPRKEDSLKLAGNLASLPGLRFRGVLAHAGHAYHCESRDQVKVVARMERAKTVGFAHRLRQSGIPVEIVSVGSTPTMSVVDSLAGVTEIRPGNYVFYDVFQAALGCCTRDRIALSVLSTVIGVYPQRDTFVIDAGALALSMDQSVRGMDPDGGFGEVETPRHGHRFPVLSLSQEHGIVGGLCHAGVHPGMMVRVFPNHACLTAAQFDRYVVLKGGVKRGLWRIIKGWNRRK